jgi:2-iminobutanoate/2-iminopropanoate deaminase
MHITHHNPSSLHNNPAFSQAVSVEGGAKLIFVGGQNGVDLEGSVVSKKFGEQTERALQNVLKALKAADASQTDVVKLTIYAVQGEDINEGFAASKKVWGMHPTAISFMFVAGLGVPGALVEIEAVAAVES